MIHPLAFLLLTVSATFLILIALAAVPSRWDRWLAKGLLAYTGIVSVLAFLITVARAVGMAAATAIPVSSMQILVYRGWIPIGAALAGLMSFPFIRTGRNGGQTARDRLLPWPAYIQALSVSVSFSFFGVEVGKLSHDAEMRQFFHESGLPVWVHYAVILAETVGASALFHPFWRRRGAIVLGLLMMAAIVTHLHNRDPFSSSLEALHLLVILGCLVGLTTSRHTAAVVEGLER